MGQGDAAVNRWYEDWGISVASWPNCPGDIKRLQGRDDYRLRVGDYRVIFEIDQSGRPIILTIMQVEKRNERTY